MFDELICEPKIDLLTKLLESTISKNLIYNTDSLYCSKREKNSKVLQLL